MVCTNGWCDNMLCTTGWGDNMLCTTGWCDNMLCTTGWCAEYQNSFSSPSVEVSDVDQILINQAPLVSKDKISLSYYTYHLQY